MSRVAIVTGAGRGIGAATVAALAADGWRVVAVDRCADDPRLPYALATPADLDAVVAAANCSADAERSRAKLEGGAATSERSRSELADGAARPERSRSDATGPGAEPGGSAGADRQDEERGPAATDGEAMAAGGARVRAEIVDVTDAEAMAQVVARAEEWGEVEAVVANAGVIAGGRPAWELSPAEEDAVVEVCLRGVMVAARVGIPALLRRPEPRSGRFVAVASAAAARGLPGLAAYCAAKAGVTGFVRALGTDLRGSGITANAIAPGSTDTPILAESARLYGLASPAEFAAQQPLERLLTPAEPAAMIRWLLGAEAAAVTGATLPVDGGLSI